MELQRTEADTTDELPDAIKSGYERAIKKCTKVIDVYPKRKKWHDDAVFLKAKATFYKKDYPTAIRRFKQFQKEYQNSPYIPKSYLFLGRAYLEDNYLEKAEEMFQIILEKYPQLNKNEEITVLLAEVAIKREGKSQAIRILEESLRSVKSDERKLEIILKLCALYVDLKMYDKAVSLLKKAPRNKDFQRYLFQVDFSLLICYEKQEEYAKALSLIEKMLKNNRYIKQSPKVLLEKGIIFRAMGKIKEAIEILEEVAEGDGPNDIKGKAWFELASIYQHELGDFEKAKECYSKVGSLSTDKHLIDIAQKRIEGMDQRLAYLAKIDGREDTGSKKGRDTTEKTDMLLYKLGEIYWLNLAEPDSALVKFRIISSDSSADSSLVMKSLYARAWILRFLKKDTTASDSLCNAIIKKYPATIVAQKAQMDLGIPVTIKTREDSANLAFIKAERLYFDKNDAVSAVNAFYKVSKHYRDLPEIASNSIYAAAWLCDNVINKNKKALMLYRMLCDSFPNSPLCLNEAKPRIKIVEDTLKVLAVSKGKKGKEDSTEKISSGEIDTTNAADDDSDILSSEDKDTGDTVSTQSLQSPIKSDKIHEREKRQKIMRNRRRNRHEE